MMSSVDAFGGGSSPVGVPVLAAVLRWTARVVGLGLAALFLFFFVAHIVEGQFVWADIIGRERAMLIAIGVALAGMISLWRWELLGSLLVLVGTCAFYGVELSVGSLPGGPIFPLFFLVGIAGVVGWLLGRRPPDGK